MASALEEQVQGLGRLVDLARGVREAASFMETAFIAVNESRRLLDYRQAVLWTGEKGVAAVSGLPSVEGNAPYIQWIASLLKSWTWQSSPTAASAEDFSAEISGDWAEWLPAHVLLCPLEAPRHERMGILLFGRDEPFAEHEMVLARELASLYGHGLAFHLRRVPWGRRLVQGRRRLAVGMTAVALAAMLLAMPVPLSVLAPAEVTALDPFLVRSPLDGVIDRFHVRPNEQVVSGQLLFELDRTNLQARLDLAEKAHDVANEEYRQAAQRALDEDRAKAEMRLRGGLVEERTAEVAYAREMMERTAVKAPRDGVALFGDPSDWVGKGVTVGEKVLQIADPKKVEMRIHLPVSNVMELSPGAEVVLYLNTDPQHPRKGTLRSIAHRAEVTPDGIAAYRLKADFAGDETLPRIGISGTARIYGERAPLYYAIMRRPWTALRQWAGW